MAAPVQLALMQSILQLLPRTSTPACSSCSFAHTHTHTPTHTHTHTHTPTHTHTLCSCKAMKGTHGLHVAPAVLHVDQAGMMVGRRVQLHGPHALDTRLGQVLAPVLCCSLLCSMRWLGVARQCTGLHPCCRSGLMLKLGTSCCSAGQLRYVPGALAGLPAGPVPLPLGSHCLSAALTGDQAHPWMRAKLLGRMCSRISS